MTLVAIDTSVLIGLIDARDVWHHAALQLQTALRAAQLAPVHFDCTVAEALSALARRLREQRRAHELLGLFDRLGACPRKKSLKSKALVLRRGDRKMSHFLETRVLTGDQNFFVFSKNP
jgi:predicted nucleic acid-binding protein